MDRPPLRAPHLAPGQVDDDLDRVAGDRLERIGPAPGVARQRAEIGQRDLHLLAAEEMLLPVVEMLPPRERRKPHAVHADLHFLLLHLRRAPQRDRERGGDGDPRA